MVFWGWCAWHPPCWCTWALNVIDSCKSQKSDKRVHHVPNGTPMLLSSSDGRGMPPQRLANTWQRKVKMLEPFWPNVPPPFSALVFFFFCCCPKLSAKRSVLLEACIAAVATTLLFHGDSLRSRVHYCKQNHRLLFAFFRNQPRDQLSRLQVPNFYVNCWLGAFSVNGWGEKSGKVIEIEERIFEGE